MMMEIGIVVVAIVLLVSAMVYSCSTNSNMREDILIIE